MLLFIELDAELITLCGLKQYALVSVQHIHDTEQTQLNSIRGS
jgi:hypothetical protein